jgi:hypothetical protein
LLTYSAVLEEGYQMKLKNINALSPLGDNEGKRSIYFYDSYLFFYKSASSYFSPGWNEKSNAGYKVIPPSTRRVLPAT